MKIIDKAKEFYEDHETGCKIALGITFGALGIIGVRSFIKRGIPAMKDRAIDKVIDNVTGISTVGKTPDYVETTKVYGELEPGQQDFIDRWTELGNMATDVCAEGGIRTMYFDNWDGNGTCIEMKVTTKD